MAGPQVTSLFTARETMSRTLNSIEGSTRRLDKAFGSLRGRLRSAVEFNLVNRGMDLFWRGVNRLTSALPDLIDRGEKWFDTVDSIVDITGMAASRASELAAVAQNVGVSSDGLSRAMNQLAKSVVTNAQTFQDYGIRVKDSNGHLLDSYTLFQNVRQRIAEMGSSLQAARLAQIAFGRGSLDLSDLLTLTNKEWERQAQLARDSGLIVGDAANAAVEAWGRARSVLDQSITGIGTQILGGIAPVLEQLTSGVTKVITANMGNIVRFVSGAAVAIASIISGLLGVNIDLGKDYVNATGKSEKASQHLRDAIDQMNNASQQGTKATKAHSSALKEQRSLQEAIARAERDLARERARTTLFSRMSAVDAELWRQQKAARIKDAQDRLAQARKAAADHASAMTKMTGIAKAEDAKVAVDMARVYGGKGSKGTIIEGLDQTVKDAKGFGLQIADAIKDAIFGPDQTIQLGGGKPIEIRQGGLVGELQGVQKWLQDVSGWLSKVNDGLGGLQPLLGNAGPLALALAAFKFGGRGLPFGPTLPTGGPTYGPPSPVNTTPTPGIKDILPWLAIATADYGLEGIMPRSGSPDFHNLLDTTLARQRAQRGSKFKPLDGVPARAYYNDWWRMANANMTGVPAGAGGGFGVPGGGGGWGGGGMFNGGTGGHFLGLGGATGNPWDYLLGGVLRKYLGPSSPIVGGQDDQTQQLGAIYGTTGDTAGNTQPIGDGQLGVVNPKFGDIGSINDVKGNVPVDASGRTVTVWTPNGKSLPTSGGGKSVGLPLSFQTNIKFIRQFGAETRKNTGQSAYQLKLAVGELTSIRRALGGAVPSSSSLRGPAR